MANNNETTTRFKVDISELKKAMQDAKKQVAYANSEFKAVSSSMDDWSKSSDGINAKLKQLNSNLKSQEAVLNEYEKALEDIKKEYGENSKEALEYSTKLNNQQAVVNKIKKEIGGYEDALTEVSKAEKIASKTGQDVADVLAETAKGAEDAGDGFTVLKGAVATFAGNALTSLVGGLRDAASNLLGLADATREYRDQMSKLESASTDAGYSVEYAKDKYTDLYGVLADETAANTTVSNFMAMGAEEKTLNSLLDSAIGIWAKYGDSIPLDGLAESINETARVGQVTGNLADALNWAGVNEDKFNEQLAKCTTEQQKQELIASTLNGVYGELSKGYQESNASVIEANKAQADYTNTLAAMGERIEPVTTTLKEGFTGLLQELLKLVEGVDMEAFTTKIEEGFAVLKDDVLPAVKDGLGWILENKDAIIAGLAGIGTGFAVFKVAGLINSVVTAFKAFKLANEGATVAQWLLNAAMSANPIGIVVTVLAAVVAALVTFIATNDEARAKFIEIWNKIVEGFKAAVQGIVDFFTVTLPNTFNSVIEFIKTNWQTILLFLINPFAGLFKYFYENNTQFRDFVNTAINYIKELPEKVQAWLSKTVDKVVGWKNDLVAKGKDAAKGLYDSVVNGVKGLPDKMLSIGSDLVKGLWNGINNMTDWVIGKIESFSGDVLGGIKNFFGINSPSKLMASEVGKWLPAGIAVGIDKNAKTAINSMKSLALDTVSAAQSGLSTAAVATGSANSGVVNNFTQVINSPKALSRLDIYRQSKNLLGFAGGV